MCTSKRVQWPESVRDLLVQRERTLRMYARIMKRVGASHPNRTEENARRASLRKKYRRNLQQNAEAIAVEVARLYDIALTSVPLPQDTDDDIFPHTEV